MTGSALQYAPDPISKSLSIRFLIVDDNRYIRYSLRSMIEAVSGWKVCGEAGDGAEALLKVGELQPDLVILDLQMPTMNGLEAAKHLSRLARGTPIIMCTMFNTPQLQQDAAQAGIRAIVDKGANLQSHLLATIRNLLAEDR
jgi:DNA-binding NarL/FixJ family response regulator